MKDEERKLMIKMGENLTELGKSFNDFKGGSVVVPEGKAVKNVGGFIQTIAFERPPSEFFKMDIQFEESGKMSFSSRQNKCAPFLKDMEAVLKDHNVIKLDGSYVR